MQKVGETTAGTVLVEMTHEEWRQIALNIVSPGDLPHLMRKYKYEHKLTQMELAEKIGISRTKYQEIDRGLTKNMSIRTYQKIISTIA